MLAWMWIGWLTLIVFLVGSAVGSFLNVCIARLPAGQSLVYPGSRCGSCGTLIHFRDNLPLLSYWLLGGRCRACGAAFSMRYFWVELAIALGCVAVFFAEVGFNVHQVSSFGFWYIEAGFWPPKAWPFLVARLLMLSVLVVAFCCALEHRHVPWSVVKTGLILAAGTVALFPWPWPHTESVAVLGGDKVSPPGLATPLGLASSNISSVHPGAMPRTASWSHARVCPRTGLQLWPVWGPLPAWLPPDSAQLGLATLLVGAVVGATLAAVARVCAGGIRGTQGDVCFYLVGGAYLGWQPTLVAVLTATVLAALLAVPFRLAKLSVSAGLTCGLGIGLLVAWLGWPWLGQLLFPIFFNARYLSWLLPGAAALLWVLGFWLRWLRGPDCGST